MQSEEKKKNQTNQEKFWKKHFENKDRVPKILFEKKLTEFWKQKKKTGKAWEKVETPFIESQTYATKLIERIFWTKPSEEEKKKKLEISEDITLEAIDNACHIFCPWPRIFLDIWTHFFSSGLHVIDFFHGYRSQSLIDKKVQNKGKEGQFLVTYASPEEKKASILFIFSKTKVSGDLKNKIERIHYKKKPKDKSQQKKKVWVWMEKMPSFGKHNIKEHNNESLVKLLEEIIKDKELDPKNCVMFQSAYDMVS